MVASVFWKYEVEVQILHFRQQGVEVLLVTCLTVTQAIAGSMPVYSAKIVSQHIGVWRHPVTVEIAGSSPVGTAKKGPWLNGLQCHPVTVCGAGSNPVGPAN